MLVAFAIVVVARAVTVYGYGALSRVAGRRLPFSWQHVLVWGGLRGTIALALVLNVPADVPGRETLQVVTFGVVLLSLVGQGLTMPVLVRRLGLAGGGEEPVSSRQQQVLVEGFVRAHEALDRLQETGVLRRAERQHLGVTIEEQEEALLEGIDPVDDEPPAGEDDRLADRIAELLVQRTRIEALRQAGAVDEAVTAALLDELDERIALLGERLAGESPGGGGDHERNVDRRPRPQRRSLDRP